MAVGNSLAIESFLTICSESTLLWSGSTQTVKIISWPFYGLELAFRKGRWEMIKDAEHIKSCHRFNCQSRSFLHQRPEPREGPRPIREVLTYELVDYSSTILFPELCFWYCCSDQSTSTSYYSRYHIPLRPRKSIYTAECRTCPTYLQSCNGRRRKGKCERFRCSAWDVSSWHNYTIPTSNQEEIILGRFVRRPFEFPSY